MLENPAYTRRLLLGHGLGTALAVLPGGLHAHPVTRPSRGANSRFVSRSLPLVVVDPGHGGKDPGAIGLSGTFEKHVAFAAAGDLARRLTAGGRVRVALTRENDVFIPLEDRVSMAKAQGAALFMSIHADAVADHAVRGASVYTLAATASDEQTAQLAARENAADRFGGVPASVPPHVADILASLVQHETRVGSARMQKHTVSALGRHVALLQNPSRHAGFAVLKASDIPSILVEMGFMSNRLDEAALRQPAHRAMVTTALCQAVDGFFASVHEQTALDG